MCSFDLADQVIGPLPASQRRQHLFGPRGPFVAATQQHVQGIAVQSQDLDKLAHVDLLDRALALSLYDDLPTGQKLIDPLGTQGMPGQEGDAVGKGRRLTVRMRGRDPHEPDGYEWDSVQDAENYEKSFAIKLMTKRAVPGSINFEILPN